MFMDIFDHHNSGIHHRTDRYRNPAKRHDVGIDALVIHDNKGP